MTRLSVFLTLVLVHSALGQYNIYRYWSAPNCSGQVVYVHAYYNVGSGGCAQRPCNNAFSDVTCTASVPSPPAGYATIYAYATNACSGLFANFKAAVPNRCFIDEVDNQNGQMKPYTNGIQFVGCGNMPGNDFFSYNCIPTGIRAYQAVYAGPISNVGTWLTVSWILVIVLLML